MRFIPLLLVFSLFAQDDVGAPEKSGTTGSIGTVTLNGQVYNQLSIRPGIPIGKLGVGLDIYLYFNDEGMYWDSWDFSSGCSLAFFLAAISRARSAFLLSLSFA